MLPTATGSSAAMLPMSPRPAQRVSEEDHGGPATRAQRLASSQLRPPKGTAPLFFYPLSTELSTMGFPEIQRA